MDYSDYQQQYKQNCYKWKAQPVRQRKLNDIICLLIFFILTASLVGIGYYQISQNQHDINHRNSKQISKSQILFFILPAITSIVISFIYILLVKSFPKIMVYTMICLSLLLLTIICIVSIIFGEIIVAICVGIILLIYMCMLGCFKQQIKTGIIIIKVAGIFMFQMPIVYLTPILKLILTLSFTFYWVYIANIMIYKIDQEKLTTIDQALLGLWIFIYLFYTFLFYYIMVFCVAVCCALWYYQIRGQNPLITAYKWLIESALGSLTFAAILISIVTFLRIIANIKRRNAVVAICLCIIQCILRSIERLLEILNHNSVIVMSVTGQSYWQSAKSTIGILSSNFPLLYICNLMTNFLVFWGLIISCGIPFLCIYILGNQYLVPCLFTTIITSIIIFSVLVESISSIFIFYCFDCKFKELGFGGQNMPLQINDLLHNSSNPYGYTEGNSYR